MVKISNDYKYKVLKYTGMSMYASYLAERTNDSVLETEQGFVTYRYPDDKTCYIVDIYVLPEFRNKNAASELADAVSVVARDRGCTKLLGSVVPSAKKSTESLRVLLGYKMKLDSSTNDFILFSRDL
jgi:ribosomal protein S18 acetylase RimI-like enzyme